MKRHLKILIPFILFCGIFFMVFKIYKNVDQKNRINLQIKNLPKFEFIDLITKREFTKYELKRNTTTFFIYFNTECEYCNYEIEKIVSNIDKFKNSQILLGSFEEQQVLRAFVEKYYLTKYEEIKVLYDKDLKFEELFGDCVFPSVIVYDDNNKLVKFYKGKVNMDILLKCLN